jgi:hypothetical protein
MNNKVKSISLRSFGFGSAEHFIAAIYHCCARLLRPPNHSYTSGLAAETANFV